MPGVEPGSNLLRDLKLRQPRGLRLRLAAAVSLPTCKEFHTTPAPEASALGAVFLCLEKEKPLQSGLQRSLFLLRPFSCVK